MLDNNAPDTDNSCQDDFDVEITPLDTVDEHPSPSLISLPSVRIQPHQRTLLLRISVILSILLLIIVVFPGSFSGISSLPASLINRLASTPEPTLAPESNLFYVNTVIPWTQVVIDGHTTRVPRIGVDAPLPLSAGKHTIEWSAEPFNNQTCTTSVPFSLDDSCYFLADIMTHQATAHVVYLKETFFTLSIERHNTLRDAVLMALAGIRANDTIHTGELYADSNRSTVVVAKQPLQAILNYRFKTNPIRGQSYLRLGAECTQLCIVPLQADMQHNERSTAFEWFALAFVSTTWSYTTADGHVIAQDQPVDRMGYASVYAYPTLVHIAWDTLSGWHVKTLTGPELGSALSSSLSTNLSPSWDETMPVATDPACVTARLEINDATVYSNVRFISGPNPATGCLAIAAVHSDNPAIGKPSSSHLDFASYFYRFGILWTVNDLAHKLRPELPQATSYVQHLALQLTAFPGQTINLL